MGKGADFVHAGMSSVRIGGAGSEEELALPFLLNRARDSGSAFSDAASTQAGRRREALHIPETEPRAEGMAARMRKLQFSQTAPSARHWTHAGVVEPLRFWAPLPGRIGSGCFAATAGLKQRAGSLVRGRRVGDSLFPCRPCGLWTKRLAWRRRCAFEDGLALASGLAA